MKKDFYIHIAALLILAVPFAASAQSATTPTTTPPTTGAQAYQFQSDGIYGCNQTGAAASSVGAFTASGVYVPVADAAVELNTGYLVYLFCSLRPLVSALSQSATAGFVKKIDVAITTGNNGNPQFSVNANAEDLQTATNKFVQVIQAGVLAPLNPALRGSTQTALAQTFSASTRQPNSILNCPYAGDLQALLDGQNGQFSWAGLKALQDPACTPMGAYQLASDLVNGYVDNAVQDNVSQRTMGNGMYPITTTDAFGNINIVTPGSMVLAQANQAQEAGLLKTINAQDLGQMVNALFAGIGAQSVSSPDGLLGITQPTGTGPSYIDQVVIAASQNVTANAVNTAITVLNGVLSTLTGYQNALITIRDTLLGTIQSLQAAENQCWNQIIQKVCVAGSLQFTSGTPTCLEIQAPITDRKSTRLNSSHSEISRMPSSA